MIDFLRERKFGLKLLPFFFFLNVSKKCYVLYCMLNSILKIYLLPFIPYTTYGVSYIKFVRTCLTWRRVHLLLQSKLFGPFVRLMSVHLFCAQPSDREKHAKGFYYAIIPEVDLYF